jgi:hypothetical protein
MSPTATVANHNSNSGEKVIPNMMNRPCEMSENRDRKLYSSARQVVFRPCDSATSIPIQIGATCQSLKVDFFDE